MGAPTQSIWVDSYLAHATMFCLAGLSLLSLLTASTLAEARSYNFTVHQGEAPSGS